MRLPEADRHLEAGGDQKAVSFLTGIIDGTYIVAFDSFYPNLITEGNFQKGYSVYGLLVDLSGLASPLAAVIYYRMGGAASLFAINALSFLIAAWQEQQRSGQDIDRHIDEKGNGKLSLPGDAQPVLDRAAQQRRLL